MDYIKVSHKKGRYNFEADGRPKELIQAITRAMIADKKAAEIIIEATKLYMHINNKAER